MNKRTITDNDCGSTFKAFINTNSFNPHENLRGAYHFYPHLEKKLRYREIWELAQTQNF